MAELGIKTIDELIGQTQVTNCQQRCHTKT